MTRLETRSQALLRASWTTIVETAVAELEAALAVRRLLGHVDRPAPALRFRVTERVTEEGLPAPGDRRTSTTVRRATDDRFVELRTVFELGHHDLEGLACDPPDPATLVRIRSVARDAAAAEDELLLRGGTVSGIAVAGVEERAVPLRPATTLRAAVREALRRMLGVEERALPLGEAKALLAAVRETLRREDDDGRRYHRFGLALDEATHRSLVEEGALDDTREALAALGVEVLCHSTAVDRSFVIRRGHALGTLEVASPLAIVVEDVAASSVVLSISEVLRLRLAERG